MSELQSSSFPFNLAAIAEDMNSRFGWQSKDMQAAMQQLLPAAQSGFDFFSNTNKNPFAGMMPGLQSNAAVPTIFSAIGNNNTDGLMIFFGPEPIRSAVAERISGITGLQQDAIKEVMPIAAALAMAKLTRPYLPGQGQEMLDAFMRGFARGRPKPTPHPSDFVMQYGQAVQSFWQGFLQPMVTANPETTEIGIAEDKEEFELEEQAPEPGTPDQKSDLDTFLADWMTAGRSIQASQFEAFDEFFAKTAEDLKSSK
ncbi:hypothetical protein JM93_02101 [Roseibium hamelinense]|uniref:DUF937 domain-containing protein n=1 Tax=Roseibium hamelinense TaxID=150831 RepID=A0A562T1I6_9HYPH|nr:hypothetical protein [Roseibium hamelinense]MTI43336.1 hypothetical protein [Roseibium hamelinense]TWI87535.1 hypothetical protein JM93_02101 [Roseibium hamelinense]